MPLARFQQVTPVLPVRNVSHAIRFYTEKIGFQLRFQDDPHTPHYAVVERDGVRLNLQSHPESEFEGREGFEVRFSVDDVDSLFEEYRPQGVFHERTALQDTPWGTREFAFFDLDGNGLFFYRVR
jgi:uncharacterized glyoxalase superfamily protein PhnB